MSHFYNKNWDKQKEENNSENINIQNTRVWYRKFQIEISVFQGHSVAKDEYDPCMMILLCSQQWGWEGDKLEIF